VDLKAIYNKIVFFVDLKAIYNKIKCVNDDFIIYTLYNTGLLKWNIIPMLLFYNPGCVGLE